MNGDHTLTAIKDRLAEVRDSLGEAHPSIPASEIVARSRRRRVRRLIPGMAAGLALAAGAALALTTLAPASHHPQVQLAAWTVVKQPGGNVSVTIRELHDPAGLQARLRADGVPATITFLHQLNPACHPWPGAALHGMSTPAGTALFNNVFPPDPGAPAGVIMIHPSALPHGGGVQLAAGFGHAPGAVIAIGAGLVRVSPQCTGS